MSNNDTNNCDDQPSASWGDPFEALVTHFRENDVKFSTKHEERRLWFSMNSGSALMKCSFCFDRTGDVLQMNIQYPVLVKEKWRTIASEFLTRANYSLVLGNFEMDMKDGEVRYHVGHLMIDRKLEDDTICRLFGTALNTAERYFPAFMRVLFAGESPEDAIDLAELDCREVSEETPKARPKRKTKTSGKSGTKKSRPKKPDLELQAPTSEQKTQDSPIPSENPTQSPSATAQGESTHRPHEEGEDGEERRAA